MIFCNYINIKSLALLLIISSITIKKDVKINNTKNRKNTVFAKTEMLIDYVKVQQRRL